MIGATLNLTNTEAHVLIDIVAAAQKNIYLGATPWIDYVGDSDDGPENQMSYVRALGSLYIKAVKQLELSA